MTADYPERRAFTEPLIDAEEDGFCGRRSWGCGRGTEVALGHRAHADVRW
jgi:hypothetical protein